MKNKPTYIDKLKEISAEKFPKFQAKEVPQVYAVVNPEQKILDIHSISQAEDIARKTNGKVWVTVREGELTHFLFPTN